ncbi:segregation and condensation protein A [Halobellus ruber]|uniref:Segregation/condensation protein A n=1 Tax=Halobellus ruber TaxID=2761102 RepID=A0A7J9SHA2_9EURY|nr:ScpA family protein [Halobellus ruber]MBB6646344.1 segregation/condensation protein A [Halobellus ruber]
MTDSAGAPPAAGDSFPNGVRTDRDPGGNPPGPDGADDEEVEPVEVLVQLAEDGEIDPWDVDLVEATDAFLERLAETDLRTSGRALFYAAVLLRMKSDALLEPEEDEEPEPEPWEAALEGPGDPIADRADDGAAGFDPVDALEAEMDRRLERKQARGSPETLDELVRELREAEGESWWKRHREYDTSESPRGGRRGTQTLDYRSADAGRDDAEPNAADVTDTAHSEDIESSIAAVREAIEVHYDNGREEVLFAEVRDVATTPVTTYLALLFLSHRGAVRLQQDDLFGDLWIRDPDASSGDDDADVAAESDAPRGAADDVATPAADDD